MVDRNWGTTPACLIISCGPQLTVPAPVSHEACCVEGDSRGKWGFVNLHLRLQIAWTSHPLRTYHGPRGVGTHAGGHGEIPLGPALGSGLCDSHHWSLLIRHVATRGEPTRWACYYVPPASDSWYRRLCRVSKRWWATGGHKPSLHGAPLFSVDLGIWKRNGSQRDRGACTREVVGCARLCGFVGMQNPRIDRVYTGAYDSRLGGSEQMSGKTPWSGLVLGPCGGRGGGCCLYTRL